MTPEELQALIAQGESSILEFKSDRGPLHDTELLETVVCLANGQGGLLLVGVEDNGTVTGSHKKHQVPDQVAALIASRTVPPLNVQVKCVGLTGHTVTVIEVPQAEQPVATSEGKTLLRYQDVHGKPGCRPLYPHELTGWYADRGQRDFTAQPMMNLCWDDLDPLEFERLRHLVQAYRGDATLLRLGNEQLARALNLVKPVARELFPTVAGLLLVGREQVLSVALPSHQVAFQVLEGQEVRVNEFYRWPLLHIFERVVTSFEVRNEERELNIGLFRVGVPSYDPRAFREAVNNALTHRDYTRLGAVHIQMRSDHILVTNPGGFVQGVTTDNILVAGPRPRNPLLADIFKRIGLVERTGRGVSIIYEGLLRTGRMPPDYSRTTEAYVTLILPGGSGDLDFVSLIVREENRQQEPFSVEELLILSLLWREREVDITDVVLLIQQDEIAARRVLERLVERGLAEAHGHTRSRRYHLSALVYREMGELAAYVRRRGFDRLQMEQMILEYVRAHKRITRREVMELCRVNKDQARYLLQLLVEGGYLELVGQGRNAHYVPLEKR
ncbi:MAG: ATP-binding protein [Anaerolineae bacterium]